MRVTVCVNDRIDDDASNPSRLVDLSLRPRRPDRVVHRDVEQDVSVDQEYGHSSMSPRVSAMISSVVIRAVERPLAAARMGCDRRAGGPCRRVATIRRPIGS